MKMIVGLGNIGPQYEKTRHNTGFMVVNEFANQNNVTLTTRKMDAKYQSVMVNGTKVLLVEPTTFMNESGVAVRQLMDYFDVDLDDILIIHDDMDLPTGKIRIKNTGSAGGHNGIKSIINHLGTRDFTRMKMGIAHPSKTSVVDFVLGKFSQDEQITIDQSIDTAMAVLNDWIAGQTVSQLANKYN